MQPTGKLPCTLLAWTINNHMLQEGEEVGGGSWGELAGAGGGGLT